MIYYPRRKYGNRNKGPRARLQRHKAYKMSIIKLTIWSIFELVIFNLGFSKTSFYSGSEVLEALLICVHVRVVHADVLVPLRLLKYQSASVTRSHGCVLFVDRTTQIGSVLLFKFLHSASVKIQKQIISRERICKLFSYFVN